MTMFHLNVSNASTTLADEKGQQCSDVLEAIVLAKNALDALAAAGASKMPWIEVADEGGNILATVRWDERPN